ncbi:hypothetical protein [Methylomonas sp. MgM2]
MFLYTAISKLWSGGVITLCLLSTGVAALECPLPTSGQNHSERVWPYLSNIIVSGIFDEPVTLRAGQYEGLPFVPGGQSRPQLRLWPELLASADLDGQGSEEKLGLISETSGGSGERVYLIVGAERNGEYRALAPALLGDRVKVRSMEVRDRQILLQIVEAGPEQALCCGTQLSQLNWQLQDGQLVLKERLVLGQLSLAVLHNAQWYLLDRPGDRLNAAHPSCTRMHIDGDRLYLEVSGQSYHAVVDEISPGHISVSGVSPEPSSADTPDARLASELLKSSQYTFRAGRLLLSAKDKDRWMNFEFAAFP